MGVGNVGNERHLRNASCRHRNWQCTDLQGAWAQALHELRIPAGGFPWNAQRRSDVRLALKRCDSDDIGIDNAAPAVASVAANWLTRTRLGRCGSLAGQLQQTESDRSSRAVRDARRVATDHGWPQWNSGQIFLHLRVVGQSDREVVPGYYRRVLPL